MTRRVSMLLLAVGLVAASNHSLAAPPGEILLEGSRTAWVDLSLSTTVTIDYGRSTLTGKGAFVGFYAESLSKPVNARYAVGSTIGAVTLRDFHGPGDTGVTENLAPGFARQLQPGRYRFYLLADGPATVRLAVEGGPRLRLKPTSPTRATAAIRQDILQDPLRAGNTQPLEVTGVRSLVTSSILLGRFRAFAGQVGACVAVPAQTCGSGSDSGADGPYNGFLINPSKDIEYLFGVVYEPGALRPGSYEARQTAINATTLQYASGAAFALSLA